MTLKADEKTIGKFLEKLARLGQTTTYRQIVREFRMLPFNGIWRDHDLCGIFGKIDKEDHDAKRPWRTALVIGAISNRPGVGFYETLAKYREDVGDPEAAWIVELNAVFSYDYRPKKARKR